jgi:hypothetical protein
MAVTSAVRDGSDSDIQSASRGSPTRISFCRRDVRKSS